LAWRDAGTQSLPVYADVAEAKSGCVVTPKREYASKSLFDQVPQGAVLLCCGSLGGRQQGVGDFDGSFHMGNHT
jgi:hypothetical protein